MVGAMKLIPLPSLVALVLVSFLQPAAAQPCQPFKVLVFSKTAGFRHDAQITAGTALIQNLGAANGFAVDNTEDATQINAANLSQYAVVVFLNTTGDILDATQQADFEGYIQNGGGFVGVHSATDTEYGWPFYGALVGAYFASHPAIQTADLNVADPNHPSTAHLPATFPHTDEWYNFQSNVANNPSVNVLLTVDEGTYTGGTMGSPHPIAWSQNVAGFGRSWYTALGHTLSTYSASLFQDHLLGGILWAAGSTRTVNICGSQVYGASSGSPPLTLSWSSAPASTTGTLNLTGGDTNASGVLCISTCSASLVSGPLTVLIELGTPGLVGHHALTFDASGQWQLQVPLTLQLPGSLGTSLFLQAAQTVPTLGLSNGLELTLCY